jgi:hypothetical protein
LKFTNWFEFFRSYRFLDALDVPNALGVLRL